MPVPICQYTTGLLIVQSIITVFVLTSRFLLLLENWSSVSTMHENEPSVRSYQRPFFIKLCKQNHGESYWI